MLGADKTRPSNPNPPPVVSAWLRLYVDSAGMDTTACCAWKYSGLVRDAAACGSKTIPGYINRLVEPQIIHPLSLSECLHK